MSEFNYRAFTVSVIGLVSSVFVILLNFLLLMRFRQSPMRQKTEYHLFTIRFVVDICFSLSVSCYYLALIISYIFPFVLFEYKTLFYITLLSSNITSIRFLLAAMISLERLIAVFFPIFFHNYRRRISPFIFILIGGLWGAGEDVMFFSICAISPFEKPCSILACTWNNCFVEYWTGSKLVIGAFSCISSLILFAKLLSIRRSINFNSDLTKTNYLCIVDAVLTLIFDFSPFLITLLFKTTLLSVDTWGPFNAAAKSCSCLIDASIAVFVLKSTSKAMNVKSIRVNPNTERYASNSKTLN